MKSEQIKEITDRAAEQLVAALQAGKSEALAAYLKAIARFHRYSLHNVLLIASQKPNASYVAGFRTWNELGRFVKKGEKGIMILAPIVRRKAQNSEEEVAEEISRPIAGFRAAFVFDVSQTDGKELPQIGVVEGDPSEYADRLRRFASAQSIAVEYSEEIAPARGTSYGGRIALLPGQSAAEEFSTLAHELAHELLHRGDRRATTSKRVRETEAEATAFVVCHAVGLETGSAACDYIQLWNGDVQLLTESLGYIRQAAARMLEALTGA
jgi:antirestriction protein ArdC